MAVVTTPGQAACLARGKAIRSRWPEPGPGTVSLGFPVSG